MNNYIKIVKGHYEAAHEHVAELNLNHKPTYWQALLVTLDDFLNRHTIEKDGGYVVYEVYHKRTLGLDKVAHLNSIYVPKHLRGSGLASTLLDMIPCNIVISDYKGVSSDERKDKNHKFYREIARLHVIREPVRQWYKS